MGTHVTYIEDSLGDLVDVIYSCSSGCYDETADKLGTFSGGAAPGTEMPDYDVFCFACGVLMHCGCEEPVATPTVVNRIGKELVETDPETGHLLKVRADILLEDIEEIAR